MSTLAEAETPAGYGEQKASCHRECFLKIIMRLALFSSFAWPFIASLSAAAEAMAPTAVPTF